MFGIANRFEAIRFTLSTTSRRRAPSLDDRSHVCWHKTITSCRCSEAPPGRSTENDIAIRSSIRGKPPPFFDGSTHAFSKRFHIDSQVFAFYQPIKMRGDNLWIDVSSLMQVGLDGLGEFIERLDQPPAKLGQCVSRLSRLLGIVDVDLHVEEVTGEDKSLDVVVDIFNRVNSGGTKLSKGDLALAKICAEWPTPEKRMKHIIADLGKKWFPFRNGLAASISQYCSHRRGEV